MEHPLASLSEGGGTAKAVTEGVSFVIYDTPPVCFASSPLKEGAKRVTSTPGWLLLPFRAIHLLVARLYGVEHGKRVVEDADPYDLHRPLAPSLRGLAEISDF